MVDVKEVDSDGSLVLEPWRVEFELKQSVHFAGVRWRDDSNKASFFIRCLYIFIFVYSVLNLLTIIHVAGQ